MPARAGCEDDGALHRVGSRLRDDLRNSSAPNGKRLGLRGTCLRGMRRDLPGVRRRMREAQDTTLSGLRARMSSLRRGVPQDGSLGTLTMCQRKIRRYIPLNSEDRPREVVPELRGLAGERKTAFELGA